MTKQVKKSFTSRHSALLASLMLSGAYLVPATVLLTGFLHATSAVASSEDRGSSGSS